MSAQPLAPGDWARPGKSQSCVLQEPLLSSSLFSLLSLPPDLHLSLFLSSSSSSSAVIGLPSLSLYMYLHPFLFYLCPWLSFLSLLLSFVLFLWIWEQSLTRTRELQLLINDYFQRWQESTARKREMLRREKHKDGGKWRAGLPSSLVWGIKYKS